MNGFHIRKKVMADHKTWPLSCKSYEVSESVKTSVNGKIELNRRKRLILKCSFRKSATLDTIELVLCALILLLSVRLFAVQLLAQTS